MAEPRAKASFDVNSSSPPTNPVPGQHWRGKGCDWVYTAVGWQKLPISGAYPEILDIHMDSETQELIFDTT